MRAREALPGVNLTTDAIVGFPGEDEAAFLRTARVVEDLAMGKVHVFPYSPRPGTPGRRHGGPPAARRAPASARGACATSPIGSASPAAGRVGGRDEVLVEKRATRTGPCRARRRLHPVRACPPAPARRARWCRVVAAGVAGEHLDGRPA